MPVADTLPYTLIFPPVVPAPTPRPPNITTAPVTLLVDVPDDVKIVLPVNKLPCPEYVEIPNVDNVLVVTTGAPLEKIIPSTDKLADTVPLTFILVILATVDITLP